MDNKIKLSLVFFFIMLFSSCVNKNPDIDLKNNIWTIKNRNMSNAGIYAQVCMNCDLYYFSKSGYCKKITGYLYQSNKDDSLTYGGFGDGVIIYIGTWKINKQFLIAEYKRVEQVESYIVDSISIPIGTDSFLIHNDMDKLIMFSEGIADTLIPINNLKYKDSLFVVKQI